MKQDQYLLTQLAELQYDIGILANITREFCIDNNIASHEIVSELSNKITTRVQLITDSLINLPKHKSEA